MKIHRKPNRINVYVHLILLLQFLLLFFLYYARDMCVYMCLPLFAAIIVVRLLLLLLWPLHPGMAAT